MPGSAPADHEAVIESIFAEAKSHSELTDFASDLRELWRSGDWQARSIIDAFEPRATSDASEDEEGE